MIIELAVAGLMSCKLVYQDIVKEDLYCFYTCLDSSREFASTRKEYRCPPTLHVERPAMPFKERDFKGNKWTKEAIDKVIGD